MDKYGMMYVYFRWYFIDHLGLGSIPIFFWNNDGVQRHFHGVKQRDRPSTDPFDHFEPSDIQRRNRNRTTQLRMRNKRKFVEITEFFSKLAASWKVPTFQNEVSIKKVTSWTVLAAGFSVSYSAPPWASPHAALRTLQIPELERCKESPKPPTLGDLFPIC